MVQLSGQQLASMIQTLVCGTAAWILNMWPWSQTAGRTNTSFPLHHIFFKKAYFVNSPLTISRFLQSCHSEPFHLSRSSRFLASCKLRSYLSPQTLYIWANGALRSYFKQEWKRLAENSLHCPHPSWFRSIMGPLTVAVEFLLPYNERRILREGFAQIAISQMQLHDKICLLMANYHIKRYY